jgi:hypothetical protein
MNRVRRVDDLLDRIAAVSETFNAHCRPAIRFEEGGVGGLLDPLPAS